MEELLSDNVAGLRIGYQAIMLVYGADFLPDCRLSNTTNIRIECVRP